MLHFATTCLAPRRIWRLCGAALALLCAASFSQARDSQSSTAPRHAPALNQPASLQLSNWQTDDVQTGAISGEQPVPAPAPRMTGPPAAGNPGIAVGEPHPQHVPPGSDALCDCDQCRNGPLGLGIAPWVHALFESGGGGGFQFADRGPGPCEPWAHRRYGLSFMAGLFEGDTLIDGELELSSSGIWELRAAHPVTDDFVIEARFARASSRAENLVSGGSNGEADIMMGDISVQFAMANRYFYLTERWQPYLTFGGGVANFDFVDLNGTQIDQTSFTVPIGAGFRYRYNDAWALRFEFRDNICPGGPLANMHNITLTGGAEYRFGGSRPSYGMWELR